MATVGDFQERTERSASKSRIAQSSEEIEREELLQMFYFMTVTEIRRVTRASEPPFSVNPPPEAENPFHLQEKEIPYPQPHEGVGTRDLNRVNTTGTSGRKNELGNEQIPSTKGDDDSDTDLKTFTRIAKSANKALGGESLACYVEALLGAHILAVLSRKLGLKWILPELCTVEFTPEDEICCDNPGLSSAQMRKDLSAPQQRQKVATVLMVTILALVKGLITIGCQASQISGVIACFGDTCVNVSLLHDQPSEPIQMSMLAASVFRVQILGKLEDLNRAIHLYSQAKSRSPNLATWGTLHMLMLIAQNNYWLERARDHPESARAALIELIPRIQHSSIRQIQGIELMKIQQRIMAHQCSQGPESLSPEALDSIIEGLKLGLANCPLDFTLWPGFETADSLFVLSQLLFISQQNDMDQLAEAASILGTCRRPTDLPDPGSLKHFIYALGSLVGKIKDLGMPDNRDPNMEPIWILPDVISNFQEQIEAFINPDSQHIFQTAKAAIEKASPSGAGIYGTNKSHLRDEREDTNFSAEPPFSLTSKESRLLLTLLAEDPACAFHSQDTYRSHEKLGVAYGCLFLKTGDFALRDRFIHHLLLALEVERSPSKRLDIALVCLGGMLQGPGAWERITYDSTDSQPVLVLSRILLDSISRLAGLETTLDNRHRILRKWAKEVRLVSGLAAIMGRIDCTLNWLERGRGVVWNQLRGLRPSLEKIQSHSPVIAARLKSLTQRLKLSGGRQKALKDRKLETYEEKVALYEEEATQARSSQEYEEILHKVRGEIPGFENFGLPLNPREWPYNLPFSGPTVLINTTGVGVAIAFIPGTIRPKVIMLPDINDEKTEQLQDRLKAALRDSQLLRRTDSAVLDESKERAVRPHGKFKRSPSVQLADILRTLWKQLVKPILDYLGIMRSENPTSRIWWCPTGALTSLPLHAAGIYNGAEPESISDYAVSSYIPTVTTLMDRVESSRRVVEKGATTKVCLVSEPNAPGLPHIPGTKTEIARIEELLGGRPDIAATRLEDKECTKEAMLAAMENHNWIHLACHGSQNQDAPMKSGFALADGRLELSRIIECDLKHAEFAFLSACETSAGDVTLSDESVHLAAAMLAIGYQGVVGTMWSIGDREAPQFAVDFYRELLARSGEVDGRRRLDSEQAAYALHYAIRQLRKRVGDDKCLVWVPYVHFGL
ncbi:hypothetical protein MD484_g6511, partial [Candolleomyces efflorescens]